MSVARMIGRAAEAETALIEALVADGVAPVATSLAEAIEADRVAVAAGEARRDAVGRTEIVAAAFAQVSRAIRRTVLLAERLDRGWARPGGADDRHAMARRQIARAVSDAIARDADAERAERLTGALRERLDSLDTLDDIGNRPAEEIIREICRDLGVDPGQLDATVASPPGDANVRAPGAERRARGSPPRERPS
ncbi:hypothetical protein [Acidisphaera sp. L21]|uniref:hypothetical protein n=1 Tax=Acidisphaera sp. L21 TaxID=1641851 RepID=UPI00131DF877|nr:hypothetical protein [Acidisphaera sp. L21]